MADPAPDLVELLTEMEDAMEALLVCSRWQQREGADHHPKLDAAIRRAQAALTKAAQFPRADDALERSLGETRP